MELLVWILSGIDINGEFLSGDFRNQISDLRRAAGGFEGPQPPACCISNEYPNK